MTLECQEGEVEIGKEITRKLAIDIQKLYVKCIIRPKYKNTSTGQIRVAELPSEAPPKCEADESLLAQVVVSKYVDHLPEYRQQQIYKRQGVVISPSTMNNWVHRIAELLRPVAECIKKQILQSGYIQMDESTIKVMFVKKGTTHQGYMWVIVDPVSKSGYFEYRHGRGRAGPAEMLRDYKGKIQSDGYTVYETIDRIMAEVEHYNCWAHARKICRSHCQRSGTSPYGIDDDTAIVQGRGALPDATIQYRSTQSLSCRKISTHTRRAEKLDRPAFTHCKSVVTHRQGIELHHQAMAKPDTVCRYRRCGDRQQSGGKCHTPLALGRKTICLQEGMKQH
ncbi:MAG: IS66 family transposase [Saprospiraceae bacterium]|nr:IS66 family transposase [Saprospiraceae bacterium]